MNWAFSIRQKIKTAFLLSLILISILAKNWLDEKNVVELGSSFASVYEDRLLVESYIYKLSDHLYQKKIMIDNCSSQENQQHLLAQLSRHNNAIQGLVVDYEKTRLTTQESALLQTFKNNLLAIKALETTSLNNENLAATGFPAKNELDREYEMAAQNLHLLSGIQVAEGKLLNEQSKQIMAGSAILKNFELGLILILGIMIQILIFSNKMKMPKIPYKPSLN